MRGRGSNYWRLGLFSGPWETLMGSRLSEETQKLALLMEEEEPSENPHLFSYSFEGFRGH